MFLIAKIVRGRRLLHELEQEEKEKAKEKERERDREREREQQSKRDSTVAGSGRNRSKSGVGMSAGTDSQTFNEDRERKETDADKSTEQRPATPTPSTADASETKVTPAGGLRRRKTWTSAHLSTTWAPARRLTARLSIRHPRLQDRRISPIPLQKASTLIHRLSYQWRRSSQQPPQQIL
ncbi:hypothetical protein DdX_03673 [Ditylenchus destructor]|uniref:Uncharacterized protein n=1 Tax=Ditylenchus destructor TaxID=166010 RepID=A0AAD4NFF6_9BILA|nr:hypothetical protein DdX_03673 [Ditylenchus destructor]